jgi:methylated-DNA-[protein]-cysteine S-methyltransferase
MKSFKEKCYSVLKKVPKGKITTYKSISRKLNTKAYRAVGNAMNKNRNNKIPCHRVINSNGKIGGFNKGINNKIELLRSENIEIKNNRISLTKYEHKF